MNLIEKAVAAAGDNWNILKITTPSDTTDVPAVVDQVISIILMIAGALAIIYLIYSGILYITAAGNPDSAKKGQQGIINAVIGIVIIILAYVILKAVVSTVDGIK